MWGEEPGEEKGGERYFDKCCACVNLDGGYSSGLMPVAGICFDWIRLFFFSPSGAPREEAKKSILGSTAWQEHHFRIEVAVRHCHLVTFVRHCTFKPSFFSPSSSFHSFLPLPIVWIPLVTFYVAIWKLEGKRSSARESLCNQLVVVVDRFAIYFCLATAPLPPFSFHPLVSLDLHCVPGGIYL